MVKVINTYFTFTEAYSNFVVIVSVISKVLAIMTEATTKFLQVA